VYVSRDGAATWHTSAGAVAPARLVATAPAQDPNDGRPGPVVAALADGTLLVSNDGGWTWGTRRQLPGGGGEILALALSPAYRSDATMFVATRQAGPPGLWDLVLWRSADGGQRWDRWLEHHVDSGPEAAQHLMAIAVSPAYPSDGLVFVGLGRRVLKPVRNAHQMHAGQRRPLWRAANLADGAAAVTALALSPNFGRDRTVFAATNAGVFVSRDAGESYQTWSDGLSPRGVLAVAASPEYREDRLVYALGLGGVLWRRHDDG
jgi:hypothetical protein